MDDWSSIWRRETGDQDWPIPPVPQVALDQQTFEVAPENSQVISGPPEANVTEAEFTEATPVPEADPPQLEAHVEDPEPKTETSLESAVEVGAVGGTLGEVVNDLYYRRVWQWDQAARAWSVTLEGPVRALTPFQCEFEGPSWCRMGPPWVYERWWRYVLSTIGPGSSSDWQEIGDRKNW